MKDFANSIHLPQDLLTVPFMYLNTCIVLQSWSISTDRFSPQGGLVPSLQNRLNNLVVVRGKLGTMLWFPKLSSMLCPPAKPSHLPQYISKTNSGFSWKGASQIYFKEILKINKVEEWHTVWVVSNPSSRSIVGRGHLAQIKDAYDITTEETGHRLLGNNHHPHQFLPLQLNTSVAYSRLYHLTLTATMHGHGYDVEMLLRTWKMHVLKQFNDRGSITVSQQLIH